MISFPPIELSFKYIYYLSTLGIFFLGLYALKQGIDQLSLLKKQHQTKIESEQLRIKLSNLRIKREAIIFALTQNQYFEEEIIPLYEELKESIDLKNMKYFKNATLTIEGNRIKFHHKTTKVPIEENKMIEELSPKLSVLYNKMGTFAMYFCTGIADEQTGYHSCGKLYITIIKDLSPLFININKKDNNTIDQSIYQIKLFMKWELTSIQEDFIENLQNQLEKGKNIVDINIPILGLSNTEP